MLQPTTLEFLPIVLLKKREKNEMCAIKNVKVCSYNYLLQYYKQLILVRSIRIHKLTKTLNYSEKGIAHGALYRNLQITVFNL